jgi:sigma-E factor negative regulatory protein RseA
MMQVNVRDLPQDDGDWLSALMDGELEDDEARRAMARLGRDPEARARWAEYSLIGDALRGELQVQPRLRKSLAAALEAEPTVLAPLPPRTRAKPAMWLAAAAAVGAISWTLWDAAPRSEAPFTVASVPAAPALGAEQMQPYLAAHQDFAQAVVSAPEMRFTAVSLEALQ